jgi:putative Mn2+ efflux pump MntP
MRAKLIILVLVLLAIPVADAFACAVCFGARDSKTGESMAMAIWFLLAAVMAVLAGISAFGFHIWRHSRMPLEPHQELAEEDLEKYD